MVESSKYPDSRKKWNTSAHAPCSPVGGSCTSRTLQGALSTSRRCAACRFNFSSTSEEGVVEIVTLRTDTVVIEESGWKGMTVLALPLITGRQDICIKYLGLCSPRTSALKTKKSIRVADVRSRGSVNGWDEPCAYLHHLEVIPCLINQLKVVGVYAATATHWS